MSIDNSNHKQPLIEEVLIQVTAPYFCAGLFVARIRGRWLVTEAAPILRYMMGWEGKRAMLYARQKGWKWERVAGPRD